LNDWPLYKNSYGQRLVSWIKNVKHYIFSRELIKVLVNKKKNCKIKKDATSAKKTPREELRTPDAPAEKN
jgi:hypothetical protein